MSKNASSSGGIGTLGLLGVVFITLKLCGVIDWSWWWVTAPFWGGFALVLAICLGVGLVALVVTVLEELANRRQRKALQAYLETKRSSH